MQRKPRHDSPGILVFFRAEIIGKNSNGVIPNGGAECMWGRLNAGEVAANWRLSTRSVVSLARSQVYDAERPPYLFAAC